MSDPRVLLVDDSTATRAFARAALEASGFDVTVAATGFEALKVLPRARFDLIVTDINMPDITGLELIRHVRESAAHGKVPLIVISTDGAERDRERGMRLGASAYLVKPFTPDALVELARRLLGGERAAPA